jgi:hypothetical protein
VLYAGLLVADRAHRHHAFDGGFLEPALGAIAALQLFLRRNAIGRDRLQSARGQLADQRLFTGDAQRVVLGDDERRDFLAGEAHAGRVRRLPG